MGEGLEVHCHRVLNGLGSLAKMIIRASPVQDPHPEQAKENWIIDTSPVHLSKPFCPSDHIGPEPIGKEEVQVYVPPPMAVDNCLVIWFPWFPNAMEGILGNLQFSVSVSIKRKRRGELPCKLTGSVQNPTMWYEPSHPNDR